MSITNLEKLVPLDLDDLQERAQEIVRKFTFAEDHRFPVISRRSDDDEDESLLIRQETPCSSRRVGLRRSASLSRLPKEKSPAQRSRLRDGIIWDHQIHGKEHAYILNVTSDSSHQSPRPTRTIDIQEAARSHSFTIEAEDRARSENQSRKMTDSFRRSLSLKSNHGRDLARRQPTQQSTGVDVNNTISLRNRVVQPDQALGRSKSLIHRNRSTSEDREVDIRTRDAGRVAASSEVSQQKVHPAFGPKSQDQVRIENRNGDIYLVHEYGYPGAHRVDNQRNTASRAHQPQLSLMTDVPADDRRDTLSPILGCKIPGIEMFGNVLDASADNHLNDHAPIEVPKHDANARRGHKQVASRFHEAFSFDDVEMSNPRRQTSRPDTPMTLSSAGGSSHYTYAKPTTINYIPIFESPRTAPRPTGIASPPATPPAVPIPPLQEPWTPTYRNSYLDCSPESDQSSAAAEYEPAYTSPRSMRSPPPARRLRSSSSSGRCETLSTIIESRYEHSSAFQGLHKASPRPALVKSHTLPLPLRAKADMSGSPTRERDGRSLRAKGSSRRSGVIFDGIIGSFI